jgi:small subunit ribosomal protein S17
MEHQAGSPEKVLRSARKVQEGIVVSDKADKTRIVMVYWQTMHRRYHKVIRHHSRFHAHDEKNESHTGDRVEIMETRPMSKLKRWRVARIMEKAG